MITRRPFIESKSKSNFATLAQRNSPRSGQEQGYRAQAWNLCLHHPRELGHTARAASWSNLHLHSQSKKESLALKNDEYPHDRFV